MVSVILLDKLPCKLKKETSATLINHFDKYLLTKNVLKEIMYINCHILYYQLEIVTFKNFVKHLFIVLINKMMLCLI